MFSRYPKATPQDLQHQDSHADQAGRRFPIRARFSVPVAAIAVVIFGFVVTVDQSLAPFDTPVAVVQPVAAIASTAGAGMDYFPNRYVNTAVEPAATVDTF